MRIENYEGISKCGFGRKKKRRKGRRIRSKVVGSSEAMVDDV